MSRRGGAVAFVLDPAGWLRETTDVPAAGREDGDRALRLLRESGWTAVPVGRGAALDAVWREADRQRTGTLSGGFTGGRA
jgi:hypothetical protein